MVAVYEHGLVLQNGKIPIQPIIGKIVKVLVVTDKPNTSIKFSLFTNEKERVLDDYILHNEVNVIYPFNDINRVTQESPFTDYFYTVGPMLMEVKGIREGDSIIKIKVFYD